MGGLARRYGRDYRDDEGAIGEGPDCFADLIAHWLDVAADGLMPTRSRGSGRRTHSSSTYPACQAVKAAASRAGRPATAICAACARASCSSAEARPHGGAGRRGGARRARPRALRDRPGFSNASIEAFAADLDEVRDPPAGGARRRRGPRAPRARSGSASPRPLFIADDGARHGVWGSRAHVAPTTTPAAGRGRRTASNEEPLDRSEAIERFGRCATRELEVLTEQPRPVLEAELWELARDWQLKPVPRPHRHALGAAVTGPARRAVK